MNRKTTVPRKTIRAAVIAAMESTSKATVPNQKVAGKTTSSINKKSGG